MEHGSVIGMWHEYLKSIGEDPRLTSKIYSSWHFGRTRKIADELVDLVVAGRKTATSSLLCETEFENAPIPAEGDLSIVTGGDGIARCIIRTRAVNVLSFEAVPAEFAWKEGEDDRSLESWRSVHERCFLIDCDSIGIKFDRQRPVICEEFEVVYK